MVSVRLRFGGDLIDMLFTVGITSAPALTGKANVGSRKDRLRDSRCYRGQQYASKQWTNGSSQQDTRPTPLWWIRVTCFPDRMFYNNLFANSLE